MGGVKEQWLEKLESRHINLANILEISPEELEKLNFRVDVDVSKEGLIQNFRIEFEKDSPSEILSSVSRLVDGHTVYVKPWELEREYEYEEQFDAISENKNYIENYRNEISNLHSLSKLVIEDSNLKLILNRQIFISVIGAVETFLSDAFINLTLNDDYYLKMFVRHHPEFQKRKFELKDIFDESEKLNNTAKKVMLDTIFHKLPVVKNMYQDTFGMEFPDIEKIYKYILNRHDLVHRNGRTKSGVELKISNDTINELIDSCNEFIEGLSKKLIENEEFPF